METKVNDIRETIEMVLNRHGFKGLAMGPSRSIWHFISPRQPYGVIALVTNDNVRFYMGLELVIHTPDREFLKKTVSEDFYTDLDDILHIEGDR